MDFGGEILGGRQSEQAHVSRLVGGHVLAGGLPQRCRAGGAVENIIDNLKQQSDALGELVECLVRFNGQRRRPGGGAEQDRRTDQRSGLQRVHVFEVGQVDRLADRGEVERLSAGHSRRTGRLREQANHVGTLCVGAG